MIVKLIACLWNGTVSKRGFLISLRFEIEGSRVGRKMRSGIIFRCNSGRKAFAGRRKTKNTAPQAPALLPGWAAEQI